MEWSRARSFLAPVVAVMVLLGATGCSLIGGIVGGSARNDTGQITASASVDVDTARVGDCIGDANTLPDTVTKLGLVPCSTPHNGEVYAVWNDSTSWMKSVAQQYCLDQFQTYIGVDYNSSSLDITYIQPNEGDTTKILTCLAYHKDGTQDTTSLKGSQQ